MNDAVYIPVFRYNLKKKRRDLVNHIRIDLLEKIGLPVTVGSKIEVGCLAWKRMMLKIAKAQEFIKVVDSKGVLKPGNSKVFAKMLHLTATKLD